MPRAAKGHIEQLPSGSFRVSVYGGIDPLTRQEIRLRSTVKDELQAQIELGRLLKEASEGRTPETGATVARLMDEYAPIAECIHAADKRGLHPTHHQARLGPPEGTEGTRAHPGSVVHTAEALR
jgi:hypothetical protein